MKPCDLTPPRPCLPALWALSALCLSLCLLNRVSSASASNPCFSSVSLMAAMTSSLQRALARSSVSSRTFCGGGGGYKGAVGT